MAQYKLAELLLRRKELETKLKNGNAIKAASLFETKVVRKNVTENVDELSLTQPRLSLAQVTAEFDYYSHQLRLTDAAIQQANWTTVVETPIDVMAPYPFAGQPLEANTNPGHEQTAQATSRPLVKARTPKV